MGKKNWSLGKNCNNLFAYLYNYFYVEYDASRTNAVHEPRVDPSIMYCTRL